MEKTVQKRSILAILVIAVMACLATVSVIFALHAAANESGSDVFVIAGNRFTIKPTANGEDGAQYDENGNLYYVYDGAAHEPKALVTVGEGRNVKTLKEGVDYTLSYDRHVNAGKATLNVNFIGEYSGSAGVSYAIKTRAAEDVTTTVTWQYYNGSWTDFDSTLPEFTYDGTDQSSKLRAVLKVEGAEEEVADQTVYSTTVDTEDEQRNTSMWLEYTVEGEGTLGFTHGGTYTITVMGESNYPLDEESASISGVVMKKIEINLPASDYANYLDDESNKLWKVQVGLGEEAKYVDLLDKAVYVDEDADSDNRIVTGTDQGKYASYRSLPLKLVLNGKYKLSASSKTLAELITLGDLVYSDDDNGLVGESGVVSTVDTVATITFDPNSCVIKDSGEQVEGNKIELSREWLIVTLHNGLRKADGSEIDSNELEDWTFASEDVDDEFFRSEHGDTVVYSYYNADTDALVDGGQFALVYSDDTLSAEKKYYNAMTLGNELVADTSNPIESDDYIHEFNRTLRAGNYVLRITVSANEPTYESHNHWWEVSESENDYGAKYYQYTHEFTFSVDKYTIGENDLEDDTITIEFSEENSVEYNGYANNYVSPVITLLGITLQEDVDYTLSSDAIEVGWATLKFEGKGSIEGSFEIEEAFYIRKASNGWAVVPSVMQWAYNTFDRNINLISAKPLIRLEDPKDMWFAITTDEGGYRTVDGLEKFYIDDDYRVSVDVEPYLKALNAGRYYLVANVDEREDGNYSGLSPAPIPFQVFVATNSWKITPSVTAWTEGEFTSVEKHLFASALYGTEHIIVYDSEDNVVYDNFEQINKLINAKAGSYRLTVEVAAGDNYSALELYTVVFSVFSPYGVSGVPWWVILVVVLGVLLVIAIVLFILWRVGVFQILTEKIVVAARTNATIEATIAAVRAAKMAEEGKKSVADAKRRERIEAARKKAQAERALSPEERAAKLEAKALAEEARVEKLRAHAEATRAKAAKMRDSAHHEPPVAEAPEEEAPAAETPETPTEE